VCVVLQRLVEILLGKIGMCVMINHRRLGSLLLVMVLSNASVSRAFADEAFMLSASQ